jgi:hypothetical protein
LEKYTIEQFEKNVTPLEVKEYYSTHTRIQTAEYFNIKEGTLRNYLKRNNLQRKAPGFNGDPLTTKNRLQSLRENFWDDKEATKASHEKAKETMRERYGDEQYNNTRSLEVLKERYGDKYYLGSKEFLDNKEQFMLDKYGVKNGYQTEASKKSIFDKYHVSNVLNSNSPIRAKRDITMIKKYGTTIPLQNEEIKNKAINTLMEKYGVTNPGFIHPANKMSKQEFDVFEILKKMNFIHNNLNEDRISFNFSNGKKKYPDFVNFKDKIIVEYNGAYWHQDKNQPKQWLEEWNKLGYTPVIIWDFEYKDFIKNNNITTEELIRKYPCTYREKSAKK